MKIQWKLLNRASIYRANRLFEQFRLNKTILSFSSFYSLARAGTPLIRAGTPLIRAVRRIAAPWLARS